MPTYGQLARVKHPDYDATYWRKIRALYSGLAQMRKILQSDKEMREVLFPRHLGEEDWVYQERVKRFWYEPYMGYLIDTIVASLANDPLRMSEDTDDATRPAGDKPGAKPSPGAVKLQGKTNGDPYYDAFFQNVAPKNAEKKSFNQLIREQITSALLCKRAWTLVDMPQALNEPATRDREQAEVGDQTYACALDPECVYDWECDEDGDGDLAWVLVCITSRKRQWPAGRNVIREEYTRYTKEGWEKYAFEYDPEKRLPQEDDQPMETSTGKHSFGRVPIVPFELPDGLWAGAKIESMATEHLNKLNALSWGQYRGLFQFLTVKLQDPNPLNPITDDQDRAVNQPIGPGRVMVLAEKDDAAYVAPAAEPFKFALEFLNHVRDEMHRVLSMMAMSVDNSGAALKRSADSKQVDQQSSAVILRDLGRRCREHGEAVYGVVSDGRGEEKAWCAQGMDQFDEVSMDSLVTEAAMLETVPIPSPTFKALYKFEVARRAVPGATDDQLEQIMDELQTNITAEDEIDQASQEVQKDRVDQGLMPGESPPPDPAEDPAGPPAKKGKSKKGAKK
jgi:hypothetical protein